MKDFREVAVKPRKVAVYASMDMQNYYTVMEVTYDQWDEHYKPLPAGKQREHIIKGYVRISTIIDIQPQAINSDEIVGHAVEALNAEECKLIDELNQKIAAVREKKAQLLALGHEKAS